MKDVHSAKMLKSGRWEALFIQIDFANNTVFSLITPVFFASILPGLCILLNLAR